MFCKIWNGIKSLFGCDAACNKPEHKHHDAAGTHQEEVTTPKKTAAAKPKAAPKAVAKAKPAAKAKKPAAKKTTKK